MLRTARVGMAGKGALGEEPGECKRNRRRWVGKRRQAYVDSRESSGYQLDLELGQFRRVEGW
jgi:hypothetical protein